MRKYFLHTLALVLIVCLFSCNKDKPAPDADWADYTVIVYGAVGGAIDYSMEDVWKEIQTKLPDKKVRVLVVYKYGAEGERFSGKYGVPGEVVVFELDKDTDFEKIHTEGTDTKQFKLYDPENITAILNRAKEELPAREYVLALYGHGGGFIAQEDYPKEYYGPTRGIIPDELLNRVTINMYELSTGIVQSNIPHLKAIMFHNCLMGGMESLMQVTPYADYLFATPFMLTSENNPLIPTLVEKLREEADFETAARKTLIESEERLYDGYVKEGVPYNGSMELLKSAELEAVCAVAQELAIRLCELYPAKKEAIDRATCAVYQFYNIYPYFDLLDYARKLAAETGDGTLASVRNRLEEAFGRAILQQVIIDLGVLPVLPAFSLSVVLVDHDSYQSQSAKGDFTYRSSYEFTAFHKLTGWGNWLDTNACLPTGNPFGQGESMVP